MKSQILNIIFVNANRMPGKASNSQTVKHNINRIVQHKFLPGLANDAVFYCANETNSIYRNMTTPRANSAMGEALTKTLLQSEKDCRGSGQSRYQRGGKFNSLFVGAFSFSLLSFILVIASVLFSFVPFSFKQLTNNITMKPYNEYTEDEIKELVHYKDSTGGLWCTDRPLENLLTDFWQSSSDACPLEATEAERQELGFRDFVRKIQVQL